MEYEDAHEDLVLLVLCATAVAERDGLLNTAIALGEMLNDLITCGPDDIITDILTQTSTGPIFLMFSRNTVAT